MNSLLVGHIAVTSWFCLTALAVVTIYFKFGRLWSVRNFDVLTLPLLAPGLLLLGESHAAAGFAWLLAGSAYFVVRMLLDPVLVRRPLLEPNLSPGGLAFLGTALLAFLMSEVVTREASPSGLQGAAQAEHLLDRREMAPQDVARTSYGPANPVLHAVAVLPARGVSLAQAEASESAPTDAPAGAAAAGPAMPLDAAQAAARIMAILCHMAVVIGLVLFCHQHFASVAIGVAVACLYLLLPYTVFSGTHVSHVLPAALVVWALVAYRRPLVSGSVLGLAVGTMYFLLFLVPLWGAFYGARGLRRFLVGVCMTLVVTSASLALTAADTTSFVRQLGALTAGNHWELPAENGRLNFWADWPTVYRIPVVVGCAVLSAALAIWPPKKTLANLLSGSAAIIIVAQFWYAQAAGTYVLWYLPLVLLVVFRPHLAERVAPEMPPLHWPIWRKRPQVSTS